MIHGLGHNKGPTMERGHAWRKHCWTKAKRDLVPTLPLSIIKMRIARAKELGLDYKTYAGVRTTSGRDLVAFLYSSNALRITKSQVRIPEERAKQIAEIQNCGKIAMVHSPLKSAEVMRENNCLEVVEQAPLFTDSWSETKDKIAQLLLAHKIPRAGVLVIGENYLEKEWSIAGKTAGFLHSDQVFAPTVSGN